MLDKLRQQHDQLLAILQRLDDGAAALEVLKRALEAHLAFEDSVFYPAFEKSAQGDRRLTRIVNTFAADCRAVSAEVAAFFAGPETERGTRALTTMLRHRITQEERILFPLYEQVLADKIDEGEGAPR